MNKMNWMKRLSVGLLLLCSGLSQAAQLPPGSAIASAHPLATAAGFEVLDAGGNAFDAAVAVSAALAVVEPAGSGIGGGGFWLLQNPAKNIEVMVDGREKAPLAATPDMYLDESGAFERARAINGPLAAGIPGAAAAWVHISDKYGRLPLEDTLAPAIRLARDGFKVDSKMFQLLAWRRAAIAASPAAADVFLTLKLPTPMGLNIVQADLAATLETLAEQGHDGFYAGGLAKKMVSGVRAAGGIWTLDDLAQYQIVERTPIVSSYRGFRIVSAAPPSSGGVVLAAVLNMLEGYDWNSMPVTDRKHYVIEAMRRAYRDRALYLGDPDYVEMPLQRLLSLRYAAHLRAGVDANRATSSASLGQPLGDTPKGRDTTHFSVMDGEGNRVSATLSINLPFGSGFMPPGTGVLLNNEMDDFSAKPGAPNSYGLVGSQANRIEPGKRMLSSMTPTIIDGADRVAILGTPGGSRIISMVLLGTLAFIDDDASAEAMVALPRYHHQYLPDVVEHEMAAIDDADFAGLDDKGHRLKTVNRSYGNMQVITWDKRNKTLDAASDPRGIGAALVVQKP